VGDEERVVRKPSYRQSQAPWRNLGLATLAALVLAACGGADPGAETESPDSDDTSAPTDTAPGDSTDGAPTEEAELEDAEISIGVLPIADYSAVYWAEEQGFFEEEGLTVDLQTLQGGPVSIQRLVSGELDFGFTNLLSFGIAVDGGAPIKVATLTSSLSSESGGIFVTEGSDIESLEDLDGMTVGVNTTSNVGDVTLNALLESEGLEDVGPSYVEVPFPEMVAGVESGAIEAGYMTEPFTSAARAAGLRNVVDLYSGPNESLPMAIYATSTEYADANPNTVAAFQRAVNAASADILENEDAFREFLPDATGTPQEVAEVMVLPIFEDSLDPEKLQRTADMLSGQGLVEEPLNMTEHTAGQSS
jgi:NitT/TauT family transport system substrate-binding protein